MPTFKGFISSEGGEKLAVVDFPDARKFSPMMVDGGLRLVGRPNPHEEQLTESQFRGKFKVGFEVLPASFPDNGFSLDAIAAAADNKAAPKGPVMRPGGPSTDM